MQKIIAAFDGLNLSPATKGYALHIARKMEAHLVGVFLEDFTRHSYSVADVKEYVGSFDEQLQQLNLKDRVDRDEAVDYFSRECEESGLAFSIHRDRNVALQELLHESIYTDLLIVNAAETLTRFKEAAPTRFIRDLLADVQCPTLVVPQEFKTVEKIVFLYDGEPSSVHALKMFSYVLSAFNDFPVEILSARKEGEALHVPDNKLMKEFVRRHYPHAVYTVLSGAAEDAILQHMEKDKKHSLVVLGAYRRSRMSRLFRPSMADVLMNHLQLPLFIAHSK
jgi:nucleotide-binding universal stress UspA family protein